MNKKPLAAIIDLSINNILSIKRALEVVGFETEVFNKKFSINKFELVVLPGVGAFNEGMNRLNKTRLIDSVKEAIDQDKKLVGICLGMQLLFKDSSEFGYTKGVNFFNGNVEAFSKKENTKRLLIGWNKIEFNKTNNQDIINYFYENNLQNEYFYFVHSYYANNLDNKYQLAFTKNNNLKFPCIVKKGNVFGLQFHPEKSGKSGIKLLKFFL